MGLRGIVSGDKRLKVEGMTPVGELMVEGKREKQEAKFRILQAKMDPKT